MALLNLFFDTTKRAFVGGVTNPGGFRIGDLYQEDGIPMTLKALNRISTFAAPFYEVVSLTGYSLQVSVGTAGSILATQTSWSLNAAEDEWSGSVDLNVSGIASLAHGTTVIF